MAQLQKEGKVRWIGVSNFNVEELRQAQAIAPITSLQPPYSLFRREVEQEILPYCQSNGLGVIVYSPMASGLLTGAMTRERAATLPDTDWRSRDAEFQEPRLSKNPRWSSVYVKLVSAMGVLRDTSPLRGRFKILP
jgi:aryl-alcohol dehydrogenase-like predicted oxidoreductase